MAVVESWLLIVGVAVKNCCFVADCWLSVVECQVLIVRRRYQRLQLVLGFRVSVECWALITGVAVGLLFCCWLSAVESVDHDCRCSCRWIMFVDRGL